MEELKKENVGRSKNFTPEEISLLISLVEIQSHILECKKTNVINSVRKESAWKQIEEAFNCESTEFFRSAMVLKTKYNNIKKETKRKAGEEKLYRRGTGGGPPKKVLFTEEEEERVKNLLSDKEIRGMNSIYDSDKSNIEDNDVLIEDAISEYALEYLDETDNTEFAISQENEVQSSQHNSWSKYDTTTLQTPKNKKLQSETKPEPRSSWAKLAHVKAKWTEQKLKKEIEVLDEELCKKKIETKSMEEEQRLKKELLKKELEIIDEELKRKKREIEIIEDEHNFRLQLLQEKHDLEMKLMSEK